MRVRSAAYSMVVCVASAVLLLSGVVMAQAPAKDGEAAKRTAAGAPPQVHMTLLQLMRGIYFVNANVVFAAQNEDPATMETDEYESASPSALRGLYGKWQAVENAALVLAEAANLLTIPGRRCVSGRLVPVQNADWDVFVQGMRDTAMEVYKAAQTRKTEAILDISEKLSDACANCHVKYRDWPDMKEEYKNRCRP